MVLRGDVGIPVRTLVRDHIADVSFQSLSSCAPTWFPRPLPRVFRERWGGVSYMCSASLCVGVPVGCILVKFL